MVVGTIYEQKTGQQSRTKRYIALAKEFCYPLIAGGALVYHHTPGIGALRPTPWCVLEYGAPDRSQGYCGVFAINQPVGGQSEYRLRLRGVDRSRYYTVTLDNSGETFAMTGRTLANDGLTIRLDGSMLSELVLYNVVHNQ